MLQEVAAEGVYVVGAGLLELLQDAQLVLVRRTDDAAYEHLEALALRAVGSMKTSGLSLPAASGQALQSTLQGVPGLQS